MSKTMLIPFFLIILVGCNQSDGKRLEENLITKFIDSSFTNFYNYNELVDGLDTSCYDFKVLHNFNNPKLPDSLGGEELSGFAEMVFFIDLGEIKHFMLSYLELKKNEELIPIDSSKINIYRKYFSNYKDSIEIIQLRNSDYCKVQQEGIFLKINPPKQPYYFDGKGGK
jgi:hypothetical protein